MAVEVPSRVTRPELSLLSIPSSSKMPSQDRALLAVLQAIRPDTNFQSEWKALQRLKEETMHCLNSHYHTGPDLVEAPWALDAERKGMATTLDHEVEVVAPFRYGRWPDTAAMKADVLARLESHFAATSTEIKDQRYSVSVRRLHGMHTLTIQVIPGVEVGHRAYPVNGNKNKKCLLLHDRDARTTRRCNFHRHLGLVLGMGSYRDTVCLLKAWRSLEGNVISNYALETIVYAASQEPSAILAVTPVERLSQVVHYAIPRLEADEAFPDIGTQTPWADFLTLDGKLELASRWKRLLATLSSTDTKIVRAFLPL